MMRRPLAAAVAAVLLLAGCGGTTGEDPALTDSTSAPQQEAVRSGSTITGTVKDGATGLPLAGATVQAGTYVATSATDGTYRLAVAAGTYTATASHAGYQAASRTVSVERRQTVNVNWSLSPSRSTSTCTYTYGAWSACSTSGTQTRQVLSASPEGCTGTPVTTQSCTPTGGGTTTTTTGYRVFANNDLGMHCVDGSFAVFSILPPYNVVDAQVVALQSSGKPIVLDASAVDVRYSAVADATGSINSTSIGKSDFWKYALALYGMSLAPGQGLAGMWMPADARDAAGTTLSWNTAMGLFVAPGVPIFPVDDAGRVNRYPLMRFSAFDKAGNRLASTDTVLPVSEETSCQNCHATGKVAAPSGALAWSNDADLEAQARRNILILHDARTGTTLVPPVLCAACHYSPALDLAGTGPTATQSAHSTMSSAMHAYHSDKMAGLTDSPVSPGGKVPTATTQACYQCHPGASTQCLRGAMTTSVDCQNCHGGMAAVGGMYPLLTGGSIDGTNDGKPRRPWLDTPRCQSCHANDAVTKTSVSNPPPLAPDGLRFFDAFRTGDPSASPILATNPRFAEQTGKLYRKSKGHGGLACEACHGSTHAIWSGNANDNVAATQLQGHAGTIGECGTCHQSAPTPGLGGPHGMHPVGSAWVDAHHSDTVRSQNPTSTCQPCHGTDYRGTVLSRMLATRSMAGKTFQSGAVVGCYDCHSGPNP